MRLAVFIDGENIAAELFDQVSSRAEVLGRCVSWRVFGDFTENGHGQWLDTCRTHGIQPDLVLPSVSGKNSTDICMVIAAMDLLGSQTVDALLLVSDDRDFLPLVRRLRAGGMKVHGFGSKPEGVELSRFHSSWTQAKGKAMPKMAAQNIEVTASGPIAKVNTPPKSEPAVKATAPAPSARPDPLAAEFSKVMRAKLATGALSLSALGTWIRQEHLTLVPLLGAGKLKKRLAADHHFNVSGNSVSLAK